MITVLSAIDDFSPVVISKVFENSEVEISAVILKFWHDPKAVRF